MNYNISYLVQQYKSGNKEALDEIIKKMSPLIIKYSRLTFSLEYEDAKQEYSLTIIKAVISRETSDKPFGNTTVPFFNNLLICFIPFLHLYYILCFYLTRDAQELSTW